ncbi:MAG TPA: TonB family protein [Bryobacteraceae bacterium]|nr:TonB family protein [Bryobacteraceae bacterium]
MTPRIDILDERESLRGPFVQSVLLHGAIAVALVVSTLTFQHSHEVWGSAMTQAGNAVPVTAVKTIPLPARTGPVNPVANDTESQVPQPPKVQPKKQVKVPEEKAIPLLKKRRIDTRSLEELNPQRYRPQPPLPNQVFSPQPPAAVSPMFEKPGSGGVGVGPNSILGNQFGAYADLVIKRVTDKWQTNGLGGLHTAPMVVITFDILRDGSVRNAKIAQRSGVDTLDYSALRAVTDAAPFEPLPANYTGSVATVELRFQLQR